MKRKLQLGAGRRIRFTGRLGLREHGVLFFCVLEEGKFNSGRVV
jgi:hypothetical protein